MIGQELNVTQVLITIPGDPVALQRARASSVSGRFYTPTKSREWKEYAGLMARQMMKGKPVKAGPISLKVVACFECPESWPRWKKDLALQGAIGHTSKPDGDNILKAVKDAFTDIVWVDDAQVVASTVVKAYAEEPCVKAYVVEMHMFPNQIRRQPA